MEEPLPSGASARLFERNDVLVEEAFRRGEFDDIDAASEISETDFFRAIVEEEILDELGTSYPPVREKHEVPVWVYVAADISLRFHAVHRFAALPYVVRSGGMVNAFGPAMGRKVIQPQTGDVTLSCEGFNKKNKYDRETPCDHDYVRKMARGTGAGQLVTWFNHDVVGIFIAHEAYHPEGIFIGDASYLFVPDNPRYAGSSRLLFDEHNHPVEGEKLSPLERRRCVWRRCYKLITLIHTNRKREFFLYAGVAVVAGKDHECPLLYRMVEQFVGFHGKGIIKLLILDRGFLDGPNIGRCKQEWGIDVLIPARRDMDIYEDVVGLAKAGLLDFKPWVPAPPPAHPVPVHRPESIRKREEARQRTLSQRKIQAGAEIKAKSLSPKPATSEVAAVAAVRTFTSCPVPLDVVVSRETDSAGREDYWVLLFTGQVADPVLTRRDYALRTTIEERHRQLKCFSDIAKFSSPSFNLVINQVVFVLLTYSLIQWYMLRLGRQELNSQTPTRALELLRPTKTTILLYHKDYVAFLTPLEHQELVLTLEEVARQKILAKTRVLRRRQSRELANPRPP